MGNFTILFIKSRLNPRYCMIIQNYTELGHLNDFIQDFKNSRNLSLNQLIGKNQLIIYGLDM